MIGFSPEWLALRAEADERARNDDLRRLFLEALPPAPCLLDLGSGAGATARALAGAGTRWVLVDDDAALLTEAQRLVPDAQTIQADLARDLETVLDRQADAITASALLDLVSGDWIERLARGAQGRMVYAALTHDGTERWMPDHPADLDIARAFDAYQGQDKGFGPAAGAMGAALLARALESQGYSVTLAPSPWRLQRARDGALMDALSEGIAQVAMQAGCDRDTAQDWRAARRSATGCTIGHMDLLAIRA